MMQAKSSHSKEDSQHGKKGRATSLDSFLGAQLRQRRSILGMSQEKLADQIGITFQQIQKYENGVNRISASRLFELSKALNVPVGLFFENIEFSQPAADFGVMAESDQTAIDGMDDIMTRKETLELIRVYYSIDDPKLRKDLFKLLRGMADNLKKQS